jgi:DNA-binding transcriptional ArsR family regulator
MSRRESMPYSPSTSHTIENATPITANVSPIVVSLSSTIAFGRTGANEIRGQARIHAVKSCAGVDTRGDRVIDVDGRSDAETVAAVLADDTARTILEATATEPMSAEELSDRCGVSTPTVYRRLETLREHDLVDERTHPDEDGHHYKEYAARLDRIVFELTDDGFRCRLSRRDRMADRFTRFVEGMRE